MNVYLEYSESIEVVKMDDATYFSNNTEII